MLREALTQKGFEVNSLPDGAQVVDRLRLLRPEVILLDVEMPVFDGIELVSVIANDPDLGGIPVLVVSGSGKRERALQAGAVAFFDKPADLAAVADMAEQSARRRRETAGGAASAYVLILGADPTARRIAAMFQRSGQQVMVCAAAGEALTRIYDHRPLLVVTDIENAAEGSIELIDAIRSRWRLRDLPVMALAGKAPVRQRMAVLQAGADILVSPPYYPAELLVQGNQLAGRVEERLGANPLTGLPGAATFARQVQRRREMGEAFAVVYFDMDNFKAYNDVYGYARADGMIRNLAGLLGELAGETTAPVFVCHIGGDDFMALLPHSEAQTFARNAIDAFLRRTALYYSPEDREKGGITAPDRFGTRRFFSFVGLSAAVVMVHPPLPEGMSAISDLAASLKKQAKVAADHLATGELKGGE